MRNYSYSSFPFRILPAHSWVGFIYLFSSAFQSSAFNPRTFTIRKELSANYRHRCRRDNVFHVHNQSTPGRVGAPCCVCVCALFTIEPGVPILTPVRSAPAGAKKCYFRICLGNDYRWAGNNKLFNNDLGTVVNRPMRADKGHHLTCTRVPGLIGRLTCAAKLFWGRPDGVDVAPDDLRACSSFSDAGRKEKVSWGTFTSLKQHDRFFIPSKDAFWPFLCDKLTCQSLPT